MKSLEIERKDLSENALRLSCVLPAKPERVFDAWTRAEELAVWLAPEPNFTCTVHELDARVGGAFRLTLNSADESTTAFGEYVVLDRPSCIEMTWQWSTSSTEKGTSRLRVDLCSEGPGTRLVLTHDRLASSTSRDLHKEGWAKCVESLVLYFAH